MDSYVLSKHPYFINALQRYDNFPYLQNFQAKKNALFLAFFLKIIGFSEIFTQIVISTLQNKWLNRGYCVLLSVFPILAPLQPSKTTFAAVFYNVVGARTLYIRETPKTVLFAVCSRF